MSLRHSPGSSPLGGFLQNQNQLVEGQVGHGTFQLAILALQFLEPFHLIDLETAVLIAPAIVGMFGDPLAGLYARRLRLRGA